ncbi:hypothetical protein GEV33_002157 [Tenebrio molitor]|uniref:Uncharacterized protein n=1 Tax=Tenebrio molitor TaxID=7067 RepID=A0A8J6HTP3_TENMO|nr:hypothetical protein GEV33_002157 [Tenebrio molitor]
MREEDKKSKNESQNVEQLKEDLQTIKEQLFALTKNRNEALNVTNELENRYTCLLNKSLHQEKEIQALKCQNAKLLAKCQCQKSLEGTEIDEVETTKLCLDQYESKLNELYKEFLNTSKVMEQSRDKVCRCIKDKHSEFEKIAASKKVLSKMIEDNDAKYTNLLKNYQQLKETERKQKEENEMLSRKVEELESQLQETSMELEMSREEAMSIAKNQQEEMDDKSKCYTYELQLKAKEIGELNSAVEELRTHICECNKQTTANNLLQTKYDELAHKYKHMLDTVNTYERNNMKRLEEIQALKRNVKDLVGKLVNLQNFAAEMTNMLNQSNLSISELSRSNEEKESIIQCQKIELASKDKQIELLVLNEDRLKKKAAQLQEDLVGMRITSCPNKQNRNAVLCADDCSMDELHELITALYEEIDKSLTKDDKIQQQKRNICCLKCNLSSRSPQKTSSCMYPNSKSQEVPWAQKSPPGSPKPASSDPQITKSRGSFADEGKFGQRKIFDPKSGRINQLEKDLIMMRSQIGGLAKNKNTISTVVNELQMSHQNLLQKNEEQERQVQILKCENQKLLEQLKEPVCNDDAAYLVGVKRSLNLCENKLNKLDSTMIKLIKCYQTSKENEVRYEYENRKLIKTNRELNNMLKQSLGDLEKFQNDADHLKKLYEELNETCDYYLQELKEKCQVTEQLSSLINELDPQPTDQVNQLDDIKVRYQKILAQQESIELKLKAFELNNKKR